MDFSSLGRSWALLGGSCALLGVLVRFGAPLDVSLALLVAFGLDFWSSWGDFGGHFLMVFGVGIEKCDFLWKIAPLSSENLYFEGLVLLKIRKNR